MVDEKVNMDSEENKTTEPQSLPGQGDLSPLEENNAPAIFGEDTLAPAGKVINLSELQSATMVKRKGLPLLRRKKRRGRPPKEQAAVFAGKKEKAAEPRTGCPSKVDKEA